MKKTRNERNVIQQIEDTFSYLERQKYALDKSAIVAVTNVKGEITYVNDKFCKISKYSRKELLGQNHRIINSGYHCRDFFTQMWRAIANGKLWKGEIMNKAKDGSYYWVATTIVPFLDNEGKPYQYMAIRFDITQQKELELTLEEKVRQRTELLQKSNTRIQQMLERLTYQNKQLQDFCDVISHNLRAPLGNLMLLLSMLENVKDEEERNLFIEKLNLTSLVLNETFTELVESTQVRQDSSISKENVQFDDSLKQAMEKLQAEIMNTNATIKADFTKSPCILYPKKYLDSIIHNLLSNSLKYKSPNRKPSISITTKAKGDKVILSIKDNGMGINLDRNGSKLFGLRKTFHEHPMAKGFGLFITKSQVEAMDGRIWAESKENKGSTFKIEFKQSQL